eukprot:GHVS01098375.1.p1 GENE.GHVS01098375.1~~GHVS01098375.1.p1  ORF type:complete len:331 (+),score=59.38 GHVS01098375.1:90-1082(+)
MTMQEYFGKIGVVKAALEEIEANVGKVKKLKKEMVFSACQTNDQRISQDLHRLVEETYMLLTKTKSALHIVSTENQEVAVDYVNHCLPASATESTALLSSSKKPFCTNNVPFRFLSFVSSPSSTAASSPAPSAPPSPSHFSSTASVDCEGLEASTTYRIRVNLYMGVAVRFRELVREFQSSQAEYKVAAQSKCLRQLQLAYPNATEAEVAQLARGDLPAFAAHDALKNTLSDGREGSVVDLQLTYHDIKKLEQCVIRLHSMFIELGALVDEQNYRLEDIQKAVLSTKAHTEMATKELTTAQRYQHYARRESLFAGLLLLILAVIFLFQYI